MIIVYYCIEKNRLNLVHTTCPNAIEYQVDFFGLFVNASVNHMVVAVFVDILAIEKSMFNKGFVLKQDGVGWWRRKFLFQPEGWKRKLLTLDRYDSTNPSIIFEMMQRYNSRDIDFQSGAVEIH